MMNISIQSIQQFKSVRSNKVRLQTVDRDLRHIRAFLYWAVESGYLAKSPKVKLFNPAKEKPVKVPREDIRKVVETLKAGKILLQYCSAEWWIMAIRILLETGLRRRELLLMKWSAVQDEYLIVLGSTSKTRKTLPVPISPDMSRRLKDWRDRCQPASDDELRLPLVNEERAIYEEWTKICKACGVWIRWKDLRSTCGSEIAEKQPLAVSQAILRHSTPTLTADYYVQIDEAALRAAKEREPL